MICNGMFKFTKWKFGCVEYMFYELHSSFIFLHNKPFEVLLYF